MLFDCSANQASVLTTNRPWRSLRKGAAAMALAVATAMPVVSLSTGASAASEMEQAMALLAEQAKPTDPQLLAKGIEQLGQGKYEDAQITLQQVKADGLPAADRKTLTDTLRKVEGALGERQAARAAFEKGEESLAAKNIPDAVAQYRRAMDNQFADPATKNKAASQLAVAQAAAKAGGGDQKGMYDEAVADMKAGRLQAARDKFVKLQSSGYKGGLVDAPPSELIGEIDKKMAAAKAPVKTPEPVPPTPTPVAGKTPTTGPAVATVPPVVPAVPGKAAYDAGVAAYSNKDFKAARSLFMEAQVAGYKPPVQFDAPARYIQIIDDRETAATRAAAPTAVAKTTQPVLPEVRVMTPEERALRATAGIEAAREEIRQYEVKVLLERARKAQDENRLVEAHGFFKEASKLDPNNKEAAAGVARLQQMIVGAPEQTLLKNEVERIDAIKTADRYYFDQAIADAKAAIKAGQFATVPEALDRARAARDAHAQYFTREELGKFDEDIAKVRQDSATEQQQIKETAAKALAEKQLDEQKREAARIAAERRQKIMDLTAKARQFIHDRNYVDAQKVINQILTLDPTNDFATGYKRIIGDYAIMQEERMMRERHDRNFELQLNRAEEGKIPYLDVVTYPDNWPEISEMRDRLNAAEHRAGVGGGDEGPQAMLNKVLDEVNFRGQGLADAVEFFRDVTGANIFVEWSKLSAAGVKTDAPVQASLRRVKLGVALDKILGEVGGPVQLGYSTQDNIITITTREELARNTVLKVYDIRDLLVIPPEPQAPQAALIRDRMLDRERERDRRSKDYGNYGGYASSAPSVPFYTQSPNDPAGSGTVSNAMILPETQGESRRIAEIVSVLKMIDPDSWLENGGKIGNIRFIQGQLAVTQTPDNQRQVGSLLERLRELHAIQVSIETRFLTIQRNYLEDIGLDLDFFFNINNPNRWSPIPVSLGSSDFTAGPVTSAPGTIAGATGGTNPAMTVQGSFLDDFQVNFLIRATQANKHSTIMTAPRVTVWNGQVASITVGTEQAYVSDLEAVTSGGSLYGSVAYNPIPSTILSGVSLTVRPTVSADRKYVTLSLSPTLSQLIDLVTFAVSSVSNTGTNPVNPGGGNAQATYGVGNIQLPLTQITTLQTIVTVPDEGTLLLGGQTIAGEIEVEMGVPILSKIPFLKRLFTNRSTAKDEQVLLILVKPKILIQREMEQIQFPLLGTKTRAAAQ